MNNLEDISLKEEEKGQENMEEGLLRYRCWGLLSNGLEAQAHPLCLWTTMLMVIWGVSHFEYGATTVALWVIVSSSPEQGCCANMRQGSSGMASCQRKGCSSESLSWSTWESDSEVAEVEGDQLRFVGLFDEYQVGCFYLDKEKELFKGRYLAKGSGRMGECGSVYVSRN